MKKVFALMAIAAMFAVSCSKDDKDDPKPDPKPDPQPEEVVPVEGDSEWSLIGSLLGKSWDTDWVAAKDGDIYVVKNVQLTASDQFKFRKNKDWGENRGAEGTVEPFVMPVGQGQPVVNNGKNLSVAADGVYDIYYNAAKEQMAVCAKGATPTWSEPASYSITIDGDFADWAAIPNDKLSRAYSDDDATHTALQVVKVFANAEKIFVYFEWDKEQIAFEKDVEHVPFHCYINTDGDKTTGGFDDQFTDACSDILLEGFIYPDGEFSSYDASVYSWVGEANGHGWNWTEDAIYSDGGVTEGNGVEGKYEFSIDRAILGQLGFPVAQVFSIGFDIQQGWNSVGILPNAAPSEENGAGTADSLTVTTI